MSKTNIQTATIQVSDQDAALDFYVNKLGFEKRADDAFGENFRWVVVAPPGERTGLVLARGFADDHTHIGDFTGIVIAAEDVQATFDEWHVRGVEFIEPPTAQPWGGIQAIFKDQDGNQFVLHSHM